MKWGLIGYGSIGARHAEIIRDMNDDVIVLTKNQQCPFTKVNTEKELLEHKVERLIIANETGLHWESYEKIRSVNKTLPILIEKPLFHQYKNLPDDPNTFVAYCLRFHPLVKEAKKLLAHEESISAHYYVGQHLSTWRKERDYRETYSAKKILGGGVMRDLSHELDLAQYLHGSLTVKYCESAKLSNLEIDTDDTFSGIFSSPLCPLVTVQMNYIDRLPQRFFTILSNEKTYRFDFIKGEISVNAQVFSLSSEKNGMYSDMLLSFKRLDTEILTDFTQGLKLLKIFDATEERK
jgi:predicted dehydrogenase